MKKKNGKNGKRGTKIGPVPWYIRATDHVDLVYRHDPAVEVFPKQDVDVAPVEICKIRDGEIPAIFKTRPLKNREHLGIASVSIRGLEQENLHEQYLMVAFEVAQSCMIEVRNPDGSKTSGAKWKANIDKSHPGLVVALGLWILGESTWDPTESKKKPQLQQTLESSGRSTG